MNFNRYSFSLFVLTAAVGIGGFFEESYHTAAAQSAVKKRAVSPAPAKKAVSTPKKAASKTSSAVDFKRDIQPLFAAHCAQCHGNGAKLGDFSIESRETLLAGGAHHPAIVPGKSSESYLIQLVSGRIPGKIMPMSGPRLTDAEIGKLKAWIDAGAKADSAGQAAAWTPPLEPRTPALPAATPGSGLKNPIDLLLQPYFKARKI